MVKEHPKTHTAVVTTAPGAPLSTIQVPTSKPVGNEVLLVNFYTSSTPLDLHQNDGHLLVTPPQILGDTVAGVVIEVGPDVQRLKPGDHVFGFTWRTPKEKAHQEYIVTPENQLGLIPAGFSMQEAVTVPDNFVTVLNVCAVDFGFELPWPDRPVGYKPPYHDEPVLVWGGSSSTGSYMIQFLKWLGYTSILAVAGSGHHAKLKNEYGASECFDYRDGIDETVRQINAYQDNNGHDGKPIRYIVDCIASLDGSVRPLSQIAQSGATVAVLLPVIVTDAGIEGVKPEYSMDVAGIVPWAPGVTAKGTRTHFYLDHDLLRDKAQPEIMPEALKRGIIKPNEQLLVEGDTLLERAEKAMALLRSKKVSGQRLVWRVAEGDITSKVE